MTNYKMDLALAFLLSQPDSAANVLEQQAVEDVAEFLKEVPHTHAATVLKNMMPRYIARICNHLDPTISAGFLFEMDTVLVAAIIRNSAKGLNNKLLDLLPERTKIACKLLLNYEEEAVGAWMVANIAFLPDDITAEEALTRLTLEQDVIDTEFVCVVDRERKLQGMVGTAELLRAAPNTAVSAMMKKKPFSISGRTPIISAASHPVWIHQDMVAVSNRNNQIVGVLRHVDLRKGLNEVAATIERPSGQLPLIDICKVYGASLIALFNTVGQATRPNKPKGAS